MADHRLSWQSWHLHHDDPARLLDEVVLPCVDSWRQRNLVKGWFFLFYDEGGPQIRLRIRTTTCAKAVMSAELRARMGSESPAAVLNESAYDRAEHYFGEEWISVRAESLNIATTQLALELRPICKGSLPAAMVLASACLRMILRDAPEIAPVYEDFLYQLVGPAGAGPSKVLTDRIQTTSRNLQSCGILNPTLKRLRSYARKSDRDTFMCAHAVHLLMNKMGLNLFEEAQASCLWKAAVL
jgi:hypothetical protein